MANEKLYDSKMLLGALYRSELAVGLARLGYGIEKIHADGRFEIAGVSRGYTSAEKTLAANYKPGDTVAFHRPTSVSGSTGATSCASRPSITGRAR